MRVVMVCISVRVRLGMSAYWCVYVDVYACVCAYMCGLMYMCVRKCVYIHL